jgi:hypothetical protein
MSQVDPKLEPGHGQLGVAPLDVHDASSGDYPPEPWDLRATVHLSLWLVDHRILPKLPGAVRPIVLFGKACVGSVWIVYRPGGVLEYNEVAFVVVVRHGMTLGLTITDIWVDSPASAAGGRQLWAIPKQLARFEVVENPSFMASAWSAEARSAIASLRFVPSRRGVVTCFPAIPILQPEQLLISKPVNAANENTAATQKSIRKSRLQLKGALNTGQADWSFPPNGPDHPWFEQLRSGKPFLSIRLEDAQVRFGSALK